MSFVRLNVLPVALVVSALLMLVPSHAAAQSAGLYTLDRPASAIGFTIYASKIFQIRREGQFKDFTGQLAYDPASPANTRVDLTVFTASVDMQNSDHTQLVKSGPFFDVDHYPTMHFSSESTEIKSDGTLSMTGDMTIRGITKRMTVPVRLRQSALTGGVPGALFETKFQIDRTEFGINGIPNWGGFKASISKVVDIHIAIAAAPSYF